MLTLDGLYEVAWEGKQELVYKIAKKLKISKRKLRMICSGGLVKSKGNNRAILGIYY